MCRDSGESVITWLQTLKRFNKTKCSDLPYYSKHTVLYCALKAFMICFDELESFMHWREPLTVLSPFLGAEAFLGKMMSLERYTFSLWTLDCRDSVDRLRRRGSTAMPMVRATFLLIPAACMGRLRCNRTDMWDVIMLEQPWHSNRVKNSHQQKGFMDHQGSTAIPEYCHHLTVWNDRKRTVWTIRQTELHKS